VTKYLHTMIRVTDPEATVRFFNLIGLEEVRRFDSPQGRFTLIFLAPPGQAGVAEVELTHNWPPEDGSPGEAYGAGATSAIWLSRWTMSTPPASACWMPE